MTFSVIFLSLVVTLATVLYVFVSRKFSYWKIRGVTYLEPTFPYGNFRGASPNKNKHLAHIVKKGYEKVKGKSQICGMFWFFTPVSVPTDLDLISRILIKDFNYFTDRGLFYNENDDPLSANLFHLDGQAWKTMRNLLTSSFTSGNMKYMFPTALKCGQLFEEILMKDASIESDLEMKDYVERFTTDVIGNCAFGFSSTSIKNPKNIFRANILKLLAQRRNSQNAETFANAFPTAAKKLKIKFIPDRLTDFYFTLIQYAFDYRERNQVRRNDFVDLLRDVKNYEKNLTVEQLAAQAFVFLYAGYETSASTIGFCLYELALNQGIQEKVRREIETVLEKHQGEFTYEAMIEMTYLDQVFCETLRKYPSAPNLFRLTNEDYKIDNVSNCIEKDTYVMVPVYAIHHDPEYYPEPEKFDPERFAADQVSKRHPCAYLPFGAGPRNCIGFRFAKMMTFVGLISLVKAFKISACEKTQIPLEIDHANALLTPKSGIYLKVEVL